MDAVEEATSLPRTDEPSSSSCERCAQCSGPRMPVPIGASATAPVVSFPLIFICRAHFSLVVKEHKERKRDITECGG